MIFHKYRFLKFNFINLRNEATPDICSLSLLNERIKIDIRKGVTQKPRVGRSVIAYTQYCD